MPRGRKSADPIMPDKIGDNSKILAGIVGDITRLLDEMDSKKGEYMAWCKSQREMINGHIDRAGNSGFSKKAVRAIIKTRELEAKIEGVREKLAEDDLEDAFDQMRLALGDLAETPLGRAALKDAGPDLVDSLANDDDEFEAVGKANAKKVAFGIKPLAN